MSKTLPDDLLTRQEGKALFYAGVAVGVFLAVATMWLELRRPPQRRVRVLYFFPDGSTQEAPATFEQSPANA